MQGEVGAMNNFTIEIYNHKTKIWEDYTKYAIFPLKFADLLDEQLDEANVSLKRVPKGYFDPLSLVRLTLINYPKAKYTMYSNPEREPWVNNSPNWSVEYKDKRYKETYKQLYVVAGDNSFEAPIGVETKGNITYDHDIHLIELTKILEGFIGDSITFTNALGNNYTGD